MNASQHTCGASEQGLKQPQEFLPAKNRLFVVSAAAIDECWQIFEQASVPAFSWSLADCRAFPAAARGPTIQIIKNMQLKMSPTDVPYSDHNKY